MKLLTLGLGLGLGLDNHFKLLLNVEYLISNPSPKFMILKWMIHIIDSNFEILQFSVHFIRFQIQLHWKWMQLWSLVVWSVSNVYGWKCEEKILQKVKANFSLYIFLDFHLNTMDILAVPQPVADGCDYSTDCFSLSSSQQTGIILSSLSIPH